MRPGARVRAVAALSMALLVTGCDLPGLRSADIDRASTADGMGDGDSWVVVTQGRPSASPTTPRPEPTPSTSSTHTAPDEDEDCSFARSAGQVIIPMTLVGVGTNSVTVSWPRTGEPPPSKYRLAAVPQKLVSGTQPEVVWQDVPATAGCTVTTTVSELISGDPYVLWLDAPDSGYQLDGTPRPTHGRSEIFRPF